MSTKPPGPKGEPVFGNGRRYADDPFAFLRACAEAYGDVVRFDLGPMETYMLTRPADIERVLVSEAGKFAKPSFQADALGDLLGDGLLLSEGDRWREQRRLANPAFDMGRLSGMADRMTGYAEATVADWTPGEVRDVQVDMTRVTLEIICDAMLGVELDPERRRTIRESLEPLGERFEPDPLGFVVPDWVPTREKREYDRALGTMEDLIGEIVAERRGTEGDPGAEGGPSDLLSILLRAQGRGEADDEAIRDEVMTILLAGHDTTALTLTYAWYLLSANQTAERRLHAEVDRVVDGGVPTLADVREFDVVERVLKEAMRLYPAVYAVFREPKVDVRLGGYRVPAGTSVMLPQWVVHRSADHWRNPDAFDIDRWAPGRVSDRHRFAYFPFGGGPRHCIGKHLSLLEGQLILATVAARYRLEYARDEPFDLRGSLTMHPAEPMEMRVVER
ncbi:MAG: cytochrome P450 [Haloferacaceae archaeon]